MIRSTIIASIMTFFYSASVTAQEIAEESMGFDDKIDSFIQPILTPVYDVVFSGFTFYADTPNETILPFLVIWLFAGAFFFTVFMRLINIRGFKQALRIVRGDYDNPNDPGEVTHFQALSAALSGTVGNGNIGGVAIAIVIGGPGATFWMIVIGFLGMTTKFVECTLGVKYRHIDENGVVTGGPMIYLKEGLEKRGLGGLGRVLSIIAALCCIAGAIGSGAMYQTNQATQQMLNVLVPITGGETSFLYNNGWMIGLVISGFIAIVIVGGIKNIVHITEKLVPTMAIIYVGTALVVIFANYDAIPAAFGSIFNGAFSPEGVTGGVIGVLVQGLKRGTFSNEAGLGAAAIAHAAAKTTEPVAEGMVALLEPFIDTVVVCTITALVIIITGAHINAGNATGVVLTSNAFASVFDWFPYILSVAVVLFAFSTSITWYYYGERCFLFLFGDNRAVDRLYQITFLISVVLGASINLNTLMGFADAMLMSMAFPNMIGLYIMSGEVREMLKSYMERVKSGEIKPYSPPS
jgi:AGCS family alanine or glycine:cation symporter